MGFHEKKITENKKKFIVTAVSSERISELSAVAFFNETAVEF